MVTEEEYNQALEVIDKYRNQLRTLSDTGRGAFDAHSYMKAEMMLKHVQLTSTEFDELVYLWLEKERKRQGIIEFMNKRNEL